MSAGNDEGEKMSTAYIASDTEITARKLASAARQYTHRDGTAQMEASEPGDVRDGAATLKIWRDGRAYLVTVQDLGEDGWE